MPTELFRGGHELIVPLLLRKHVEYPHVRNFNVFKYKARLRICKKRRNIISVKKKKKGTGAELATTYAPS